MTLTGNKASRIRYTRRGRLVQGRCWLAPQEMRSEIFAFHGSSRKISRVDIREAALTGAGTAVAVAARPDVAAFRDLVRQWKEDTIAFSSIHDMALHPAYQRIIGMGAPVLPLILRELETDPNNWFWALKAITGDDPVDPQDRGRIRRMAEAWLTWARRKGIRW